MKSSFSPVHSLLLGKQSVRWAFLWMISIHIRHIYSSMSLFVNLFLFPPSIVCHGISSISTLFSMGHGFFQTSKSYHGSLLVWYHFLILSFLSHSLLSNLHRSVFLLLSFSYLIEVYNSVSHGIWCNGEHIH